MTSQIAMKKVALAGLTALTLTSGMAFGSPAQAGLPGSWDNIWRTGRSLLGNAVEFITRPGSRAVIQQIRRQAGIAVASIQLGNQVYRIAIDCHTGATAGAEGLSDQNRREIVTKICSYL